MKTRTISQTWMSRGGEDCAVLDSAIRNNDGAVVAYQFGKWQIRFEEVEL